MYVHLPHMRIIPMKQFFPWTDGMFMKCHVVTNTIYYHLLQTLLKPRDKSITVYKQCQNQHHTCHSPHTHVSTGKRHLLPTSRFVTNNELLFSLRINVFHFIRNTQILLDWHIVLKMPPTQLRTYDKANDDVHKHTTDSYRLLTHLRHTYKKRNTTPTPTPGGARAAEGKVISALPT